MSERSHIRSSDARVAFQAALFDLMHVVDAENPEVDHFEKGVYFFEGVWSEFSAALKQVHPLFDAITPQERKSVQIDC